jgi:hypothetical protein
MRHVALIISLLCLLSASCGARNNQDADLDYRVTQPRYAGLTRKVMKPSISVCFNEQTNTAIHGENARFSILTWIDALREVSDQPLATSVDFVDFSSPCDVKLYVGSYSPARTALGSTPSVYMNYRGWYGSRNVNLHEFGHAFGLLDTYNGRGGSCQPGQPDSVMCTAKYLALKPDDIAGIRKMFELVQSGVMGLSDPEEVVTVY